MASVAFIDSNTNKCHSRRNKICYHVARGVRARKEEFGVLFYRNRDTKLIFVRSGIALDLDHNGKVSILTVRVHTQKEKEKIRRLLDSLLEKGLILE
jgi:putative mycofactocin binding protein MftB